MPMTDKTILKCQRAYAYMIEHRTTARKASKYAGIHEATFRTYRLTNNLAMFTTKRISNLFAPAVAETSYLSIRRQAEYLSSTPDAVIRARKRLKAGTDVRYTA